MAEIEEIVDETRRGIAAAMRTLQAISRFVSARRPTPVQRPGIGGDLPQVAPPVIGEPAPAPDQDAVRLGDRLDQHFPGWEQEPAFWDSRRDPEQAVDQFQQRWPQWRDGFGETVAAVPENRVGEVFADPADRRAYEATRAPAVEAPAVEEGAVDPALYGSDLSDSLGSIDRGAAAVEAGEYTDPDGRHAERPGGLSVAEIAARVQPSGQVAESADRVTERYGPLLDRLGGAELDHLQRFAGGDEQNLPGTGGKPEAGSGERSGGAHRAPDKTNKKETER